MRTYTGHRGRKISPLTPHAFTAIISNLWHQTIDVPRGTSLDLNLFITKGHFVGLIALQAQHDSSAQLEVQLDVYCLAHQTNLAL